MSTHNTLAQLFNTVISADESEREPLLLQYERQHPELIDSLRELLAYSHADRKLFQSDEAPEQPLRLSRKLSMPETIGDYVVEDVIGDGGMAVVYRARQQDPQRTVAIKMIKLGMDTEQVVLRFDHERQTLAAMNHPGIANIFDAGISAEGKPYFVMEHVDGQPLDRFSDEHNLNLRQRMELFLSVCDAVSHAHQKGIVHRDLKPGNILVRETSEGSASKVIDFGIARSMDAASRSSVRRTQLGQVIGTPAYMSPEQANPHSNDIDTRTDVYSLGVILRELLVGKADTNTAVTTNENSDGEHLLYSRPSSALKNIEPAELTEIARQRGIAPHKLVKSLKGDLDWILLKALSTDRNRRYQTVTGLANDLRRYLHGRVVEAHPPSAFYQLSRFVNRNRLVAGVSLAAFLTLLASTIVLNVGISRAKESAEIAKAAEQQAASQAELARHESAKATAVTRFMLDLFGSTDPGQSESSDLTAQALLERGVERINQDLKETPDVQAALLDSVAQAYLNLGMYAQAEPLAEQALALFADRTLVHEPAHGQALRTRAMVYFYKGDYIRAEALHEQALEVSKRQNPEQPALIAEHLHNLGNAVFEQGRHEEAYKLFSQALTIRRVHYKDAHEKTADSLNSLASASRRTGDLETAIRVYQESLSMRQALGQDVHPATAITLSNLGVAQFNLRDYEAAEGSLRRALTIQQQVFSEEHPQVGTVLANLGATLAGAGKLEEARVTLNQSVSWHRKLLGDTHPGTANAMLNLGSVLYRLARYEQSESLFRECVSIFSSPASQRAPTLGIAKINLANSLLKQAKVNEAMSAASEGLKHLKSTLPESHPWIAVAMASLGAAKVESGDVESGIQLIEESLPALVKTFGEEGARTVDARAVLAQHDRK